MHFLESLNIVVNLGTSRMLVFYLFKLFSSHRRAYYLSSVFYDDCSFNKQNKSQKEKH